MIWRKHYKSMYEGSLVGAGGLVFAVMGYVITHQEADREGVWVVRLNPVLLGTVLGEKPEQVRLAIEFLCRPDPKSSSPADDGRRLVPMGASSTEYRVVNGKAYQEQRDYERRAEQNREAQRRHREKQGPAPVTAGQKVYEQALETHGAEHAAINAGGDKGTAPRPKERDFAEEIYQAYPRRVGKPAAKLKIRKALAEVPFERLLELTIAYAQAVNGQDPQFIPHPATWFNQARYNDDPSTWTRKEGAPVQDPRRFNPNAQLAGAQTDPYAAIGAAIGAGDPEPGPDTSEPPPE